MKAYKQTNIITVYGESDGANTTGVFKLGSDSFKNTVDYLQLDKGLKFKVWNIRISGDPATVFLEYTDDVTVASPSWRKLDAYDLVSPGIIILEKRRPIVIVGRTGKEAIRFTWNQSTAGKTKISIDIEIEELEGG